MAAGTDKPLTTYHFSLGNSSVGPIGFCARVKAYSKEEAVEILNEALETLTTIELKSDYNVPGAVEYLNVYINPEAVTTNDIDDEEEVDEEEVDEE